MAEERIVEFYCDICDKNYNFKSRYDHHLISAGHIQLQQLLTLEREIPAESDDLGCYIERSAPVDADSHDHEDEDIMPQSPISESDVRRFLIIIIDACALCKVYHFIL